MNTIKLAHSNKKDYDSVEDLIEENLYNNNQYKKLNDESEENHVIPHLHTHDGIKDLNFVTKVEDSYSGFILSYLSSNIFYSLLMKR